MNPAIFDKLIDDALFNRIVENLQPGIELQGLHGLQHWRRVARNANWIVEASCNDLDEDVVYHFAYLHDSCREHDGRDRQHGARAAERVMDWWAKDYINLSQDQALLLATACEVHSSIDKAINPTLAACLDADRLDLGRCGIQLDPGRLSLPLSARYIKAALQEATIRP